MNSVRPGDHQLPRAGEVVAGKYLIESVIGTGGMGVVLGARDTSLGRLVAIKFLAPSKAANEGAAARFVREARAAASIQSEHVVRVFDVGTLPNGASYIVMEHLAGADLAHVLTSRGALPIHEAVDYLLQACEAIGEAHARGIVHRDLKPQNLFLTTGPDGTPSVKVLDFGISKAIDEGAVDLTATDTVMGTPLYMSPEQVRSLKSVDLRSDIWSLGAILFELLTTSPIYEAQTASALCAMIAMDPPTPLRARVPHAPAELEAFILRCLHKDPAGRFQDLAAFADALAPFATERGRTSIARIARVVRAANGSRPHVVGAANVSPYAATGGSGEHPSVAPPAPPAYALGTTGGHISNLPPGAVAAHGFTAYAQQAGRAQNAQNAQNAQRATQETWQHQTATGPNGEPRRSGPALFAVLGAVGGVFVLLVLAGGGLYIHSLRSAAEEAKLAAADAGVAAASTGLPDAAVAATNVDASTTAVAVTSTSTSTSTSVAPRKPVASKDGGAVPAAPTQSTGPGGVSPAEEERLRNERLKEIAAGRCQNLRFQLSRNDASNAAARSAQLQTCNAAQSMSANSGSSNCERQICRTACTILKDQLCIQRLDVAERSNPLKF